MKPLEVCLCNLNHRCLRLIEMQKLSFKIYTWLPLSGHKGPLLIGKALVSIARSVILP